MSGADWLEPCVVGSNKLTAHGFLIVINMISIKVVLNLKGLTKFTKSLSANTPAMIKTLKQWGVRYRGFVQQRFDQYSKGGGNWAPLKPATIARRRKGTGTGDVAIFAIQVHYFVRLIRYWGCRDHTKKYNRGQLC